MSTAPDRCLVTDPGTGKVLGTLPEMTVQDTKEAINHAHEALKSSRKTSEYERSALLTKIFQCVACIASDCSQGSIDAWCTGSCRTTRRIWRRCISEVDTLGSRGTTCADIGFGQIITAENGKPLADARGEVTYGGEPVQPAFLTHGALTPGSLRHQRATSRKPRLVPIEFSRCREG